MAGDNGILKAAATAGVNIVWMLGVCIVLSVSVRIS